ncbi:MAG: B12-binding domain-containing radical SAM protein [Elusimicrobia bacterium]|nr:B12-binding domain-containing radical SAM protein [Elusimicrobiota bacterium]
MASPERTQASSPKVLLINPPQKYFEQSRNFELYFPLGLLSLAAMVRRMCQVKVLDCLADRSVYRRDGFVVHGTSPEMIEAEIAEFQPDIIGVSIPFSSQSGNAVAVGQICRRAAPKAIVLFGGPDPSVRYDYFLKKGYCDYCVVGEGEEAFADFIDRFKTGSPLDAVEGVASFDGRAVRYAARKYMEPDELPFPAYDLIDVQEYLYNKNLYVGRSRINRNSMSMITSRGCPYPCVFCSIQLHMGKKFRGHSPEYVIRHLRHLKDRYGITNFHFEDDNFSFDQNRFERILDAMIDTGLEMKWDVPNGMRLDTLTGELLEKMKRSGCVELTIAIESANQEVLDNIIKKHLALDGVPRIAEKCRNLGIRLSAFYIIGFPGETIATMQQTIDMALSLLRSADVLPYLNVATPLYGTKLYADCVEKGLIRDDLSDEELASATQAYGKPLISTQDFSTQDIQNLLAGYRAKLKMEWLLYAVKHPIYGASRLADKCRAAVRRMPERFAGQTNVRDRVGHYLARIPAHSRE